MLGPSVSMPSQHLIIKTKWSPSECGCWERSIEGYTLDTSPPLLWSLRILGCSRRAWREFWAWSSYVIPLGGEQLSLFPYPTPRLKEKDEKNQIPYTQKCLRIVRHLTYCFRVLFMTLNFVLLKNREWWELEGKDLEPCHFASVWADRPHPVLSNTSVVFSGMCPEGHGDILHVSQDWKVFLNPLIRSIAALSKLS